MKELLGENLDFFGEPLLEKKESLEPTKVAAYSKKLIRAIHDMQTQLSKIHRIADTLDGKAGDKIADAHDKLNDAVVALSKLGKIG